MKMDQVDKNKVTFFSSAEWMQTIWKLLFQSTDSCSDDDYDEADIDSISPG